MAGAFSGTALIGAAIVAFVLLVSLQALRDWPLAGIGGTSGGGATRERTGAGEGTTRGGGGAEGASATGGGKTAGATGAHRNGADRTDTVDRAGTGVGGAPPSATPQASESGSAAGGGSTGSAGSTGGESSESVTGTAAKTVNETVSGVDEATGGALGETGVTKVSEETVNGLLGGTP